VGRPAEHRIGKRVPSRIATGVKLNAIGNVAHGIDAPQVSCYTHDHDRALIVDLYARRLQPKIRRVSTTSGAKMKQVAGDRIAPL